MGCVCSCMKKNNRIGVQKELREKKEKKKRRWWRRIMSSSRVSDSHVSSNGQSVNVTSSTASAFSSEGHLTPTTAPTSPPEGKDVGSMTMESLVALQMQALGVQIQNEMVVPQHILRSDKNSESGQGEGQGSAPTKSAVTNIDVRQLGFPNIGNSCYMNATLQCLLSLSCFWRPIRAQWSSWMDSFGCKILRCFLDLQQARLSSCSIKQKMQLLGTLTACVAAHCPTFGEDYEQDAHEFLMLCLLQLKEEGKTLRASFFSYMCPVESMEFHIKSVRTCTSCGLQRSRVEDFNHLSVDLCPTLSDSLHAYFKPSVLELSCECDQGCSASEVVEFFTLPRVLILHVKRFNMLGQKLTDVMEIPAKLDLSGLPGVSSLRQQSSGPAGTQDTNLRDVLEDISSPEPGTCTPGNLQTPKCDITSGS